MEILKAVDLHKKFGSLEVLKGVDISVNKGDVIAIIGPSGSGKSTLLRLLTNLEKADKGSIQIMGEYMVENAVYHNDTTVMDMRKKIGMVFQSFELFPHLSVLGNITLAPMKVNGLSKEEAEQKAMDLLRKTGLEAKAENYPCELSGGQKQRVAIARALAMDPDILCFDEPTSALDPELTGEVLKVIKELAMTDMTMIIVTHEMGFAREVANQVLFMDEGVILDRGTPEQIFGGTQNERIRAFLSKLLSI